jgi:hypothetical protein
LSAVTTTYLFAINGARQLARVETKTNSNIAKVGIKHKSINQSNYNIPLYIF